MERLKRKLQKQGVSVFEFCIEEYVKNVVALNTVNYFSEQSIRYAKTNDTRSMPIYSAILAVDESANIYTAKHIFDDFTKQPVNQRSAISIYENNIFENIEVASFFIQNLIPKNIAPLYRIIPSDLSDCHCLYIIKNL